MVKQGCESKLEPARPVPKFDKPKVFLIDMDDTCLPAAQKAGFNVSSGTFGAPCRITPTGGLVPLANSSRLPNAAEQEIIFIDLLAHRIEDHTDRERVDPRKTPGVWAQCC